MSLKISLPSFLSNLFVLQSMQCGHACPDLLSKTQFTNWLWQKTHRLHCEASQAPAQGSSASNADDAAATLGSDEPRQ